MHDMILETLMVIYSPYSLTIFSRAVGGEARSAGKVETAARDLQGAGQGAGPAGGRWGRRRAAAGSLLSASPVSGPASVWCRCRYNVRLWDNIGSRYLAVICFFHLVLRFWNQVLI